MRMAINSSSVNRIFFYTSMLLPIVKVFVLNVTPNLYYFIISSLYFLVAICFFHNRKEYFSRLNRRDGIIGFLFIFLLITSKLYPDYDEKIYTTVVQDLVEACLIGFIVARVINFEKISINSLRKIAYSLVIMLTIIIINYPNMSGSYSMNYAYNVLYAYSLLIIPMMVEKRILDFLVSIFALVLIFLCGTRGPLLFALILFMFTVLTSKISIKTIFRSIMFMFILLLLLLSWTRIVQRFSSVNSTVFSFRLINRISDGDFFVSNDRINLYQKVWNYCYNHIGSITFSVGLDKAVTKYRESRASECLKMIA